MSQWGRYVEAFLLRGAQTVENLGTADIAGMKNQGHAFEDSQHLRTQKAVSIRNDSDNLLSSARPQSHTSFGIKDDVL